MAHTQTWNASFDAIPANGDDASEGALRIRNLKRDIRERLETDHIMDETNADGRHAQITFDAPRSSPTNEVNVGFLYTKDVSAKAELHWMDEAGNELQLTSGGSLKAANFFPFASNDSFLARVASVPSGWATVAVSNKAVRINSGATTSTGDGGSNAFTTALNSNVTSNTTGAHTHTVSATGTVTQSASAAGSGGAWTYNSSTIPISVTGSAASNGNHSHTVNVNVQYRDFREIKRS